PAPPLTSSLSLHDALPISRPAAEALVALRELLALQHRDEVAALLARRRRERLQGRRERHVRRAVEDHRGLHLGEQGLRRLGSRGDRKSTRLNSSHGSISYA